MAAERVALGTSHKGSARLPVHVANGREQAAERGMSRMERAYGG